MAAVFEEKNISKAVLRMGLPAMLGQLTTLIYNMADTFFVSLTKEPAMIAAVTLCTPILLMIMSVASVFGMGGNSVIARLLGENKNNEVRNTWNFCLYAMYGILLGAIFLAVFCLLGTNLASVFLHDASLIHQAGYFIRILGLSAPMLGIINMVTSYYQALGAAVKSLCVTIMRNILLFIPAVILLNRFWQLNGVIAAQPVVETVLAILCLVMYAKDANRKESAAPGGSQLHTEQQILE